MSGELDPMPLVDILGAVGYRTAMGGWPPGFDDGHALLTLVHVTERLRLSLQAHHDHANLSGGPCPICVRAQGAAPEDVLTDLTVPDFPPPPDGMFVPPGDERCGDRAGGKGCECARPKDHPGPHRCAHGEWR